VLKEAPKAKLITGHTCLSIKKLGSKSREKHRFTPVDDYDQNRGLARIRRGTGGLRTRVKSYHKRLKNDS